jgi:hypothetical protein
MNVNFLRMIQFIFVVILSYVKVRTVRFQIQYLNTETSVAVCRRLVIAGGRGLKAKPNVRGLPGMVVCLQLD